MPRLRLGVALLLPPPVADEVDGLRRALGDRSLDRVPAHLTLVPPVNVAERDLPGALAVLRGAAAAIQAPLAVTLGAPTSFLPANPVVYLPVTGGEGEIRSLREGVWHEPLTRALSWPYVPHVTLADGAPPERIEAAAAALGGYRASVTFEGVHLLVERRPGPRWHPLADVLFGATVVVARGSSLAVELVRSRLVDPEALGMLRAAGAVGADGVVLECGEEGGGGAGPLVVGGAGPLVVGGAGPLVAGGAGPLVVGGAGPLVVGGAGPLVAGGFAVVGGSPRLVVTARRQGAVVGVAAAWLTAGGCRRAVFVAPDHRLQGVGRQLGSALDLWVAQLRWAPSSG